MKIIIAGDGPLRSYVNKKINDLRLNNLVYLGRLSHGDLKYLYGFCNVAISSYSRDSTVSMPIKAFDYLKFGLPVLNSLMRDFGNIVLKKRCGVNYESQNVQDMYEKLLFLIENDRILFDMRQNAIEISREFDHSIQYKLASEFIEKIVNEINSSSFS